MTDDVDNTMTAKEKKLDDLAAAVNQAPARRRPTEMGHYGIRIDVNGTWHHGGTPFTRLELVKLFSTVLKRQTDGSFWLETPVERGRIDVEDSPFIAVEIQTSGEGNGQVIRFRTNLDHWVTLSSKHELRIILDAKTEEPRPYLHVRDGLEARLLRSVFYELVDLAVDNFDTGAMGVWSDGQFHKIGPIEGDA